MKPVHTSFRFLARVLLVAVVAGSGASARSPTATPSPRPIRNVILVMTDGLRWQELFRGADSTLLTKENYWEGRDPAPLRTRFLAGTAEERRQHLMPFVWQHFVQDGLIYGDQDAGSTASVTNGFNFSYPGYSETLTGYGDPRINSNENRPNPNVTVLEWLNKQPGLQGSVAAFGAWSVISGVVNAERCGFPVNTGYDPLLLPQSTPSLDLLNATKRDSPRVWDDESFDAPTFYTALEYLKLKHPHVMFLSLGETDDWAHGKNYGEYLLSANRVDADLKMLWDTLQSMPEYRDSTALIFTTDHGRGAVGDTWTSHGQKLPDSKNIFIAVSAPGLKPQGILEHTAPVTQSQIASTIAGFLGQDWKQAEPRAGGSLFTSQLRP